MSEFGKRKGGGRRAAERQPVPLIALFTTMAGSWSGNLVDISCTGAQLEGLELPRLGEVMEIRIEGVKAFGIVTWSSDHNCGVAFDAPLTAGDVVLLRQKASIFKGLLLNTKAALDDWQTGFAR